MSNQNKRPAVTPADPDSLGLRERKKLKTRLAISDVATRLFITRGFDAVTIAEVARAAEVSVNTVFNYFTTKEELFFDRGPELQEAMARIIRERKRGESPLAALRRAFRRLVKGEVGPTLSVRLKPFIATIDASRALQAHARLLGEQYEQHLAETLIAESSRSPRDVATARALAAMITGVQSLLVREVRERVMAEDSEEDIRAALSRLGERSFELLLAAMGE
jgi:AcrR family transcriptional regulator